MNRPGIVYPRFGFVPEDLWKKRPFTGQSAQGTRGLPEFVDRGLPPQYIGNALLIGRGFSGFSVVVNTTATLILSQVQAIPHLILNPSRSVGLTTYGTLYSGTQTGNGNTQATPLGVANYMNAHFFLDVTVITGTWSFILQAKDPISGNWADVQNIASAITATGTSYANVGTLGVVTDLAVRWTEDAAGSITFSLGYVLKDGTAGTGAGISQTVYLGSNDGVSIGGGYPIMEGQKETIILGEGVDLWGIADVATTINMFKLQAG